MHSRYNKILNNSERNKSHICTEMSTNGHAVFFHWDNYIVGLDFTQTSHHRRVRKTSLLHYWEVSHPQDRYRILTAIVETQYFKADTEIQYNSRVSLVI